MTEQLTAGAFAPFEEKTFRTIWTGGFVSNIAAWMQNIGVSWVAAVLTTSPFLLSMIQVATSVPALFLSYPAGVIADHADRRKLLIGAQVFFFMVLLVLTVLTQLNYLNMEVLIIFTFLMGCGSAFSNPIWQAITPEVVSPGNLKAAVALNGVSFNLSRAIGPALGGLLLTYGAIQSVFLFNIVAFVLLIWILYQWKNQEIMAPPESFAKAYGEGITAVLKSRNFLKLIVRTIAFTAFVGALFALLPHLSKYEWHQTTIQYMMLWVFLGAGAICGSLIYGKMTELLRSYQLVAVSCIGVGATMISLALTGTNLWHYGLIFLLGFGWIWSTSTLNVLAQLYSPDALRARFLSVNITIFQGSLALTSLFWGWVSNEIGTIATVEMSGVLMVAASVVLLFFPMEEPSADPGEKVACTAPILIPAEQQAKTNTD
ncbi:hypothetical protein A4H97_30170 [Niastella yeongjuensis]|uniref:Major facilitator superfamily (MFS) profile domain-containing protein n=1 Tax=Niastella yeongjuensis TaxID=354355 RepID=A0A1V9EPP3_9BACT|nr:MFS transporter [Niastella yeongjuensis]OQP48100.1 hypothetical protein A4H97_30170 [Niastella yeongjuensis]SEO26673.1 Predicted arabinose efflux permease, MFS family [Niastella yeongjuensis]